jgi:hypothetical protein
LAARSINKSRVDRMGPAVIGLRKEVLIDKPIIDDQGVNRIFDAEDAERRMRSQDFFIADGR